MNEPPMTQEEWATLEGLIRKALDGHPHMAKHSEIGEAFKTVGAFAAAVQGHYQGDEA